MTALFPTPFPDELLYSIIARLNDELRYFSDRALAESVFGCGLATAVFDLPGRIDALLDQLPAGHPYTAEHILYEHTTLPYYAPFIDPSHLSRVEKTMRSEEGEKIHTLLGVRASRVSTSIRLRLCISCVRDDRQKYGLGYWHRSHQLPGVRLCSVHAENLQELRESGPRKRHSFQSLEQSLDQFLCPLSVSPGSENMLLQLSRDTRWLLASRIKPDGLLSLWQRYRSQLKIRGWMRTGRQIRMRECRPAFVRHYGSLLVDLGCNLPKDRDGWLERLLRKPRTSQHPLHHLLVIRFLGSTPAQFLQHPMRTLHAERHSPGASQLRIGKPSDPAGKKSPSFRSGSPNSAWDERLKALVRDPSMSLRAMAQDLGVAPKTVQRHARRLGVWRPTWTTWDRVAPAKRRHDATKRTLAFHRNQWRTLREANPTDGTHALCQRAPATYSYLYRYDREWLSAHRPPTVPARSESPRIDWAERDKVLLQEAGRAVSYLQNAPGRPVWIRKTTVLKQVRRCSLFFRNEHQLPQTAQFLSRCAETRLDFARRKIMWAISHFVNKGECPPKWKLIRKVSLRPDLARQLGPELEEAIIAIRHSL